MSNYTVTTLFAPKDALLTGDPLKKIRGAQIDPEFAAIAVAIATKLDASQAANPTALVGLTVVNGVASSYMRSDAAPRLSQAIAPTWTGVHIFTPASGVAATINQVAASAAGLQINAGGATDTALLINGTAAGQSVVALNTNGTLKGLEGIAGAANQLITGSAAGDYCVRTQGGVLRWSTNSGGASQVALLAAGNLQHADDSGTLFDTGWRDLPQRIMAANGATVAADRGKSIRTSSGINLTFAAAGTYPVGTVIVVFNSAVANTNLIAGSGDAMVLAGTATTGSRVLAQNGLATCYYGVSGFWYVSGPGVS